MLGSLQESGRLRREGFGSGLQDGSTAAFDLFGPGWQIAEELPDRRADPAGFTLALANRG